MVTKKGQIDYRNAMKNLTSEADKASEERFGATNRFDRAATIVAALPSGVHQIEAVENQTASPVTPRSEPSPVVGEVIWVDIRLIRDNPVNARQSYDQAHVNARAASIAKDGMLHPGSACVDFENPGSGQYILIGGHYRKKALLQLGHSKMQVKLVACTNYLDLHRISTVENTERTDNTPLDNALAWNLLLKGGYGTQEQIAESLGIPRTRVTKTLRLLDIPEQTLELFKEFPLKFPLTIGYLLAQISTFQSPKETTALALRIKEGSVSTRDLEKQLDNLQSAAPPRKTKEISRQYKITSNDQVIGYIKDWDSGKVAMEVTMEDPAKRQQLIEELQQRFGVAAQPV